MQAIGARAVGGRGQDRPVADRPGEVEGGLRGVGAKLGPGGAAQVVEDAERGGLFAAFRVVLHQAAGGVFVQRVQGQEVAGGCDLCASDAVAGQPVQSRFDKGPQPLPFEPQPVLERRVADRAAGKEVAPVKVG